MSDGIGNWKALEGALEIVGVHAVVLHTGKVLFWSFDKRAVGQLKANNDAFKTYFNDPNLGSYQIWDPVTEKAAPAQAIGRNSFCSGQCTLPDGTIFIPGGQDIAGAVELTGQWDKWVESVFGGSDEGALKDIQTYDPIADAWIRWPDMPDGRYYPTCLTLDNGTALVAGGLSNLQRWVISRGNGCENDQFAIYTPGLFQFSAQPRKFMAADQYPILQLLPGSRHLFVHRETTSYLFDLDSVSFITDAEFMPPEVGGQTYPWQTGHVLLAQKEGEAPRILMVGGSTQGDWDFMPDGKAPAVKKAFIFDYNNADPARSQWRRTLGDPNNARVLSDTVLLPDGTVFVVNGLSSGGAAGALGPTVETAEIFDPATETFTLAAPPSRSHPRGYHSTAVLLPDARVAIAGNTAAYNTVQTDDVSIEIYSPPYLFKGPRPTIHTTMPSSLDYGATLTVDNSRAPLIDQVMMMRPCAVTHSVDMGQLAIWLETKPGNLSQTLDVAIPKDRSLAPPGPYMLFFLAKGVPSTASWVFVGVPAPSATGHRNGGTGPADDCAAGGPYTAVSLGVYDGKGNVSEAFDGDCAIEKIDNGFTLDLESRHGDITIDKKIDQHSWVHLKACGAVQIGEKIDQHSTATIIANRNVVIGQKVDGQSSATITSLKGMIDIGQKIDYSSDAHLKAGTSVHIGQKIDQHSNVTIVAQGDVTIDQGIDQHSTADITSESGSIIIIEAVDGHADATLRAPNGNITIGKVDGGANVKWHAQKLICSNTGGGTVTQF